MLSRLYAQSDFRGRAGYAIGRFMPFLAAGVAYGQSQQIDTITGNDQGLVPVSSPGPPASALDYMLTEGASPFSAEYLYQPFAGATRRRISTAAHAASNGKAATRLRFGLAYFFH